MTSFRILGPVEVMAGDRLLPVGGRRQLRLLAFLLLNANRAVSADELVDVVWGVARTGADNRLQMAVTRLRKALEPLGGGSGPRLQRVGGGYMLRVAPGELDADIFQAQVREGREAHASGDPARAVELLRSALELWRGPPLAEVAFEDFAQPDIRALEELRLEALEARVDAELDLGRHQQLVGELGGLLAEHPSRERLAAQLMLALYRCGRQGDALAIYGRTRARLAEELGLDPGPALRELQAQILAQSASLDLPIGEDEARRIVRALGEGDITAPAVAEAAGSARQERKVITALFCDLAGSTALGEQLDPEDLHVLLSRYHTSVRGELERFGGTVEKFIGDAVVAVFGAPLAHEDDPERAVRAALAVKEWVAQQPDLHARVAVNTGEALVSLGARPATGEHMASGDVLNTAARLQAVAPVDGILVGEQTYRATDRVIDYHKREPVRVKGKAEAVPVWEVVGARSRLGIDVEQAPQTAFVGRERELRLLRDALERAREEREPQFVTLVGVPGIGKSRIVYELSRIADADSGLVIWRQGRCLPYGEGVSFWALGEMVKAQAGILESDPADTVEAKLAACVAGLLSSVDVGWVLRWLRPLVGRGGQDRSHGTRAESFPAWRRFLEAIAERGPAVLVFEDLHWADEGLLDFLDGLAEWTSGVPLLVVCTARPEFLAERPGWGGGRTNVLTLSLAPLSADETAQLVHGLLGRALLPAELQQVLLERAGGVPLYAEEFARVVDERGTSELSIPGSVQGIIAARLDALLPAHKRMLQDAAVVGKVFWAGAVAALAASAPEDLDQGLRELVRRELVRRERQSSVEEEVEYVFRHELIREVAYSQIPRAQRSDRHRRSAEWLAARGRPEDHAELLAHHYVAALEYGRASGSDVSSFAERALMALEGAGERAMALGAYASAVRYFRAGLDLLSDEDAERARWLYRYGAALHWGENGGERELEEAVTRLRALDPETAASAALMLARCEWLRADRAALDRWLAEVNELLAGRPESTVQMEALVARSGFAKLAADYEQALPLARQALERLEGLDRPDLRARALSVIGGSRVHLGDEGGIDDEQRAVQIARDGRALFELDRALNNYEVSLCSLGRLRDKDEVVTERRRSLKEFGGTIDLTNLLYGEADADFIAGRWDSALAHIDSFFDELEPGATHTLETSIRTIRAVIEFARDQEAEARSDIDRAVAVGARAGEPQAVVPNLCWRAWMLLADGQAAAARDDFKQLLAVGPRLADALNQDGNLPQFTWVAVDLGHQTDAESVISDTAYRCWADVARAILIGDPATAADLLAAIGHRPAEAYARLRAGGNQLHQALAFYRSVGATRYIREAESALATSA